MKNPFHFEWSYLDYEIRVVYSLTDSNKNYPEIELIKWSKDDNNNKKHCFTIAYYRWDKEGGHLVFVGNRPFREIAEYDLRPIWKHLWLACEMLQDWYDKERDNG